MKKVPPAPRRPRRVQGFGRKGWEKQVGKNRNMLETWWKTSLLDEILGKKAKITMLGDLSSIVVA
jgi:hypothetical protein